MKTEFAKETTPPPNKEVLKSPDEPIAMQVEPDKAHLICVIHFISKFFSTHDFVIY